MILYPDEALPIVKFANGRTFEMPYYKSTLEQDGLEAYVWRMSLKLAWATSIHKSQSLTLDSAEMDLSKCFDAGMAYVALSRVTGLKNVRITQDFKPGVFMIDPDVVKFYKIPFGVQRVLHLQKNQEKQNEKSPLPKAFEAKAIETKGKSLEYSIYSEEKSDPVSLRLTKDIRLAKNNRKGDFWGEIASEKEILEFCL